MLGLVLGFTMLTGNAAPREVDDLTYHVDDRSSSTSQANYLGIYKRKLKKSSKKKTKNDSEYEQKSVATESPSSGPRLRNDPPSVSYEKSRAPIASPPQKVFPKKHDVPNKKKVNIPDRKMQKITKDSGKGKGESKSIMSGKGSGKGKGDVKSGKGSKKGMMKDGKGNDEKTSKPKNGMTRPPDETLTPEPDPEDDCRNEAAMTLHDIVPDIITKNPTRCCDFEGPIAVYVTHAEPNNSTISGFEPFWDLVYNQIRQVSDFFQVCFVMTGYNASSTRSLSNILIDATIVASSLPQTIAMMVTDPTDNLQLLNTVRPIVRDPTLPSIGVFNQGYNNIIVESLISGQDRIPYIGFMSDGDYGKEAARYTLNLLDGVPAVPLCFNGRPDLNFIGERCAVYYTELTRQVITPSTGVVCSATSSLDDIFNALVESGANAVFSHIDCCAVVARAVRLARDMGRTILAVGCQDEDTTNGDASIDFVTTQPMLLQAYSPSTWVNLPVRQEIMGNNGRDGMFFPSTSSLINTAIYTVPIV